MGRREVKEGRKEEGMKGIKEEGVKEGMKG